MIVKNKTKMLDTVLSYTPFRTCLLALLIIGSVFSLKAQDGQEESYRGFKLELGLPFTRFNIYSEDPSQVGLENVVGDAALLGISLGYLAPQYYINNNISAGLEFEFYFSTSNFTSTYLATGDYYLGDSWLRPAFGLGVGITSHRATFEILEAETDVSTTAFTVSPRVKLHLAFFNINVNYDINLDEAVPHTLQFGIGWTLFGSRK